METQPARQPSVTVTRTATHTAAGKTAGSRDSFRCAPDRTCHISRIHGGDQATIGKSLFIKGELSGSESLYIDGKVEGAINLSGNRVTVGRNGQVSANISAREVVVLGKVRGNINASDRVDIRGEGSLTGDVVAQRISIEDGAYFKGGIDIRKPGSAGQADAAKTAGSSVEAAPARV